MHRPVVLSLVPVVIAALLLGSCASDDGSPAAEPPDTAADEGVAGDEADEAPSEVLRVLMSNDDGIDHPGIDLMVRSVAALPDVEITVVAPAENRSGSGDELTPGGAPHRDGETLSGFPGTAVDGWPADAVVVALDELDLEPHVIVSGINDAQNIGPFAEISGTVGVVRTGLRRGIPGVAVSAGLQYNDPEFEVAAQLVIDWIEENRAALLEGTFTTEVAHSFNVPTCDPEDMGELVEVPRALEFPEGVNPFESDCDLADPDPADDVAALRAGYPALTPVPAEI
jgi:5'-nucleotidase